MAHAASKNCDKLILLIFIPTIYKQLLDEVEHDITNYQNRGLCYLPQPSASADNTDTRILQQILHLSCQVH